MWLWIGVCMSMLYGAHFHVCHYFLLVVLLLCVCVDILTMQSQLQWACYDFCMISMQEHMWHICRKVKPCKDCERFFYSAAFQMSLKTHFWQQKKREKRRVSFGRSCRWSWSVGPSGNVSVSRRHLSWILLLLVKPTLVFEMVYQGRIVNNPLQQEILTR